MRMWPCLLLLGLGEVSQVAPVPQTVLEVRLINVIDGDTYVFEPRASRFTVRLSNADTWESRKVRRGGGGPVTEAEITKGLAATEAARAMLESGTAYVTTTPSTKHEAVRTDSFGRTLGRVTIVQADGTVFDLGQWLKEQGHTRR